MLAQQLSEAKPPEKTPPKKRLPAFIFTESIQEVVKRQDGSMSRGIITISSIEPSWLNHGRRYSGPRTSPTHPLIWVHRSCFPQDSDRSLFFSSVPVRIEDEFCAFGRRVLRFLSQCISNPSSCRTSCQIAFASGIRIKPGGSMGLNLRCEG